MSTHKDELYQIALELERFASEGLKEMYRDQIAKIVDKLMLIAKEAA